MARTPDLHVPDLTGRRVVLPVRFRARGEVAA